MEPIHEYLSVFSISYYYFCHNVSLFRLSEDIKFETIECMFYVLSLLGGVLDNGNRVEKSLSIAINSSIESNDISQSIFAVMNGPDPSSLIDRTNVEDSSNGKWYVIDASIIDGQSLCQISIVFLLLIAGIHSPTGYLFCNLWVKL